MMKNILSLNNNKKTLGKIVLGIYNYYNTDRLNYENSNYIDYIIYKILLDKYK